MKKGLAVRINQLALVIFFYFLSGPASAQDLSFFIYGPSFQPTPHDTFERENGYIFVDSAAKGKIAFERLKALVGTIDEKYFSYCTATPSGCRFLTSENRLAHLDRAREVAIKRAENYRNKVQEDLIILNKDRELIKAGILPVSQDLRKGVDSALITIGNDIKSSVNQLESATTKNEVTIDSLNKQIVSDNATIENLRKENDEIVQDTRDDLENVIKPEVETYSQRIQSEFKISQSDLQTTLVSIDQSLKDSGSLLVNPQRAFMDEASQTAYRVNDVSGELAGRGQTYLTEGLSDQGTRLIERAHTYENFKKGAILPYQHVQLDPMAQTRFHLKMDASTFVDYETIVLFNAFVATPGLSSDDSLYFQTAIIAQNMMLSRANGALGVFLSELEHGWAFVDFAKGVTAGVYHSIRGAAEGIYNLVFEFPTTANAIASAVYNYERAWGAVVNAAEQSYDKLKNCDNDPEACGEVIGHIAGEIAQAMYGGELFKAGSELIRADKLALAVKMAAEASKVRAIALIEKAAQVGLNDASKFSEFMEDIRKLNPCRMADTRDDRGLLKWAEAVEEFLFPQAFAAGPCDVGVDLANAERSLDSAKKISVDIVSAESRFGKAAIGSLADEKLVEAASRWGVSKNGMNQLFEHTVGKDVSRLAGLERRAGLAEGSLTGALGKSSDEVAAAMKQMDSLAGDVIKNGTSKVDGLKTTSWKQGIVKPDDGIAVIQYDGKLQSLQPMAIKDFNSL